LKKRYEDNDCGIESKISTQKVAGHVQRAALYSYRVFARLPDIVQTALIHAMSAAIAGFVSDVSRIKIEVHGGPTAPAPETPLEVVQCDDGVFREHLDHQARRLKKFFNPAACATIWKQRQTLQRAYDEDISLRHRIDSCRGLPFNDTWNRVTTSDGDYELLASFASGLAAIAPGTHNVESDFSVLKYIRSPSRRSLSSHSLKGQLHAKQFFEVVSLADEVLTYKPL